MTKTRICGIRPEALRRFALEAGVTSVELNGGCVTIEGGTASVSQGSIGGRRVVHVCVVPTGGRRVCSTFQAKPHGLGGLLSSEPGNKALEALGEAMMMLGVVLLARVVWQVEVERSTVVANNNGGPL